MVETTKTAQIDSTAALLATNAEVDARLIDAWVKSRDGDPCYPDPPRRSFGSKDYTGRYVRHTIEATWQENLDSMQRELANRIRRGDPQEDIDRQQAFIATHLERKPC